MCRVMYEYHLNHFTDVCWWVNKKNTIETPHNQNTVAYIPSLISALLRDGFNWLCSSITEFYKR